MSKVYHAEGTEQRYAFTYLAAEPLELAHCFFTTCIEHKSLMWSTHRNEMFPANIQIL